MFRRKMNLSQEELAEKCRVSRQAIVKWKSGDSVPTIEKLVFLADIYELSLDELVGRITREESLPGNRARSIRCLLPLHWQRKNFTFTLKHRG